MKLGITGTREDLTDPPGRFRSDPVSLVPPSESIVDAVAFDALEG